MVDFRSNDQPFLGSYSMEALSCGPGHRGTGNTLALPWNSSATCSTNVYEHLLCAAQCQALGHRDEGSAAPAPGKLYN